MKAQSTSMTLYHFDPGHHREVSVWHDQDHKPEVVGTMPGIFISQRWVAPPDLMQARPESSLEHNGGEYVNMYWSTDPPDKMSADFGVLGHHMALVGRMEPMKYIHRTWGSRLRPASAYTRPGVALSADALTCAPQVTGLMVVIGELIDGDQRDAYARWHETEHIPLILDTGVFSAAVKLMSDSPAERNVFVALYYTERPDVCDAYVEFQKITAGWRNTDKDFPNADQVRKRIHHGMYRPSIGFYNYYD